MNNTVIAILVIVVIAIVGWIAYTQGAFDAKTEENTDQNGIEIQIGGGGTEEPDPAPAN